jgi:hypothetical protein
LDFVVYISATCSDVVLDKNVFKEIILPWSCLK